MVECSVVNNCNGETKSMTRKECCVDDSQGRSYVAEGMCYSCIGIHYVFVGTLLNVLFGGRLKILSGSIMEQNILIKFFIPEHRSILPRFGNICCLNQNYSLAYIILNWKFTIVQDNSHCKLKFSCCYIVHLPLQ